MKIYYKIILACICITMSHAVLKCQNQVNSMYFLDNTPIRHNLNPSFQPLCDFYIGIPLLSYTKLEIGNNTFAASSLLDSKLKLINNIADVTQLNAQSQISILDIGFRHKTAYWNFNISTKLNTTLGLPKDIFKLLLFGNANIINGLPQYQDNYFNLQKLRVHADLITEFSTGYAKKLSEKWSVGAKIKLLYGSANMNAYFNNFHLSTGVDKWNIHADGTVDIASPLPMSISNNVSSINISTSSNLTDYLAPAGIGGAIDVGVNYKLAENLQLALGVINVGYMKWKKNSKNISVNFDYTLDDSRQFTSDSYNKVFSKAMIDSIIKNIESSVSLSSTDNPYHSSPSPTINASMEYGFLNTAFSMGILSSTIYFDNRIYQDITTSCNFKPSDWLNMVLSYSLFNGRGSNIGFGLGLKVGITHIFLSTDYIPITYTNIPTSLFNTEPINPNLTTEQSSKYIRIPYDTKRLNFALGINLVFNHSKQKTKADTNTLEEKPTF